MSTGLSRAVSVVLAAPVLALMGIVGIAQPEFAHAGDGFPPNGAWVYGSQPYGVNATARANHRHHVRHRAYRSSHVGWPSYGRRSSLTVRSYYPATTWSYGYVGAGYPWRSPYSASPFGHFYHSGFSGSYLTYRTYIPLNPLISTVPWCSPYPAYSPMSVSPLGSYQVNVVPNVFSASVDSSQHSAGKPVVEPDGVESIEPADRNAPIQQGSMPAPSSDDGVSDSVVTLLTSQQASYANLDDSQPVPDQLLHVADALLKVGGTREAAQAYAQLSLRYGASDLLFGRRLVAQVAAGDFEQATVIVDSAQLAEFQIRRSDLPEGSLEGLGIDSDEANALTDRLAQFADRQQVDPSELRTLASWLTLTGDEERAQRFFDYATQVAEGES